MENRRPRWPLFVVQVLGSVSMIAPVRLWTDVIKSGATTRTWGETLTMACLREASKLLYGCETKINKRGASRQKGSGEGIDYSGILVVHALFEIECVL